MSISTPTYTDDAPKEPDAIMDPPDASAVPKIVVVESTVAIDEKASNQPEESSLAKADVPEQKLCGVCHENEWKYKCSRCYLPSCSLACSTVHKATHPALEPKPAEGTLEPKQIFNGPAPRAGTVAAAGFKGPFAVLDDSKELKMLFKMYPKLPSLLDEIHTATLRPLEELDDDDDAKNGHRHRNGRKKQEEPWTLDKGLEKGRQALIQARGEHECVQEYSDLILQILSGEAGMTTAELVQKELAQENAKIIEALLKGGL